MEIPEARPDCSSQSYRAGEEVQSQSYPRSCRNTRLPEEASLLREQRERETQHVHAD